MGLCDDCWVPICPAWRRPRRRQGEAPSGGLRPALTPAAGGAIGSYRDGGRTWQSSSAGCRHGVPDGQVLILEESSVDDVGEAALEAAEGFGSGLTFGAFLLHVGLGFG